MGVWEPPKKIDLRPFVPLCSIYILAYINEQVSLAFKLRYSCMLVCQCVTRSVQNCNLSFIGKIKGVLLEKVLYTGNSNVTKRTETHLFSLRKQLLGNLGTVINHIKIF